jgi:glycosyltransferase involved in cell wall biosynthesis
VIATSVGEHGGLVIEGETGHQVPPGDPEALARVLATSLADRPGLASMGESARTYAAANIGWLKPAGEMMRMYADLHQTRSRRGPKA